MLNILEILRKHHKQGKGPAEAGSEPDGVAAAEQPVVQKLEISTAAGAGTGHEAVSILCAVNRELEEEKAARAQAFHRDLTGWLASIYQVGAKPGADFCQQAFTWTNEAVALLGSAGKELIQCFCVDYPVDRNWLPDHTAGVTILSLELARGLGYPQEKLSEVGAAAMLHDLGMLGMLDLLTRPALLDENQRQRIKGHPAMGAGMFGAMGLGGLTTAGEVILQEHERADGSGYPSGMRADAIHEYAQIIALADVYEALVHARPHRARFSPPRAITMILNDKHLFGTRPLKKLLERIGVYPAGSWVRLNTKETGLVSTVNPSLPLRPMVSVMFDEAGARLNCPRQVDLAKNPLLCVEECLDEPKA